MHLLRSPSESSNFSGIRQAVSSPGDWQRRDFPLYRVDLKPVAWCPARGAVWNNRQNKAERRARQTAAGEVLQLLVTAIRAISAFNRVVGLVFAWLSLAVVVVCFIVVIQRYFLHTTQLWMQDLYVWLSGAMFTAVAGFAMLRDDHVRVDIVYRMWSIRGRAIADLVGVVVFLLPFICVVLLYAWPYVSRSWRLYEGSANIGGMPGLFILKSFVIVFCLVVGLQGLAWAMRSILVIAGKEDLLPERLRYRRDDPMETPL
jgi:TRAP-type mannitol/chloroaromatic compound transport system permease small subunit